MTLITSFLFMGILAGPMRPEPVAQDQLIAVQVGRAITVSGDDIDEATILIEGGRIREIGKDVDIPAAARVLRMPQAVAMPGVVNCHSTTGLRIPFERMADVPFVSVLDGIDPSSEGLENSLRDGVTCIHVLPSNVTRLGGQGAVIRPAGRMVDEMIVKAPSAMKLSLAPPPGETRMGNMAALRKAFFQLYLRMKGLQEGAGEPRPLPGKPPVDPTLESILRLRPAWKEIQWAKIPQEKIAERDRAMVDLVRGKIPAFIFCPRVSDIFKAFELIDANNLRATIVLGPDAWKLDKVLTTRKNLGPVILDPNLEIWETDPETGTEKRHLTPLVLHRAGVRFALQALEDSAFHRGPYFSRRGEYHFWHQAASLVRQGIPRRAALRAITLTPAEILGLDHRMGSLEKGKDANIAVFSGDPLDARSWVEMVLIEGAVVYEKTKDRDLELLLKRTPRPF